jgi:hypothetical protein
MTEPILIKAGSDRLKLGLNKQPPKVDCRVVEENNYQALKRAFDLHNVSTSEVFENYGKPFTSGRDLWDFITKNYSFSTIFFRMS